MPAERGYYRMWRGWLDHPALKGHGEPYCRRAAWAWLIEHACWAETRVDAVGETVPLEVGELSYSLRYMAKAWRWSEAAVRRFLNRLASDGMIERTLTRDRRKPDARTDAGQVVIRLSNYARYQVSVALTDAGPDAGPTQVRRRSDANNKKGRREESLPLLTQGGLPPPPPATQREIFAKMREVWNALCSEGERKLRWIAPMAEEKRVRAAARAWRDYFGKDLAQWRAHCERVAASDFLMGRLPPTPGHENWLCDFDFAVTPQKIQRLREGKYDNKGRPPAPNGRPVLDFRASRHREAAP